MRIFRKIFLGMLIFGFAITNVGAASEKCGTKKTAELNREVANVKANYEILQRLPEGPYGPPDWWTPDMGEDVLPREDYMKVNITNLSENFYAEVTNDQNRDKITLTANDMVDGIASFERDDFSKVVRLTIKIYATDVAGCAGQEFKTLRLTLPRSNIYSGYDVCSLVPDYYLCQKYVTFEKEITDNDFSIGINKQLEEIYQEEEEETRTWWENVLKFVKDNLVIVVIGGVLVIGAGTTATIIIIRNRRRREI